MHRIIADLYLEHHWLEDLFVFSLPFEKIFANLVLEVLDGWSNVLSCSQRLAASGRPVNKRTSIRPARQFLHYWPTFYTTSLAPEALVFDDSSGRWARRELSALFLLKNRDEEKRLAFGPTKQPFPSRFLRKRGKTCLKTKKNYNRFRHVFRFLSPLGYTNGVSFAQRAVCPREIRNQSSFSSAEMKRKAADKEKLLPFLLK